MQIKWILGLALGAMLAGTAAARDIALQPEPAIAGRTSVTTRDFMVASAHPLATEAGHDVLAAGGSAADAAVAMAAGTGVVPVRKAGKLPWSTITAAYELEYGEAVIAVHSDAFAGHRRVLLVDDVLAPGGTLAAAADLVARAGGEIAGTSVLLELTALGGRDRLGGLDVHTVLRA